MAPAPPVRFRRAGNSTSWRGMPRRRSTFSVPLPSEQKPAEEEEPPEVTTYWHEKNENYHVVERTIGIDSCPHRCFVHTLIGTIAVVAVGHNCWVLEEHVLGAWAPLQ